MSLYHFPTWHSVKGLGNARRVQPHTKATVLIGDVVCILYSFLRVTAIDEKLAAIGRKEFLHQQGGGRDKL